MAEKGCSELEALLRAQRHNFINHIQIIHAMLQMGRVEKAMKYMEDLAKNPELLEESLTAHKQKLSCRCKLGL